MCGIIGYAGRQNAVDILLDGLRGLEYRGYDSAGISVCDGNTLRTIKNQGRLEELAARLDKEEAPLQGGCGIGHTRWATHGAPSRRNCHPHCTERLSLVHNGIIENYLQIREFLAEKGIACVSDTDTETAARLIDYHYRGDPLAAIARAVKEMEGSYAFGILFTDHPGAVFALRKDSPLIVGAGQGENYIASDVAAILNRTRRYCLLEEGEIARVTADAIDIRDFSGNPLHKDFQYADWDVAAAQKGGYPHFMLKEIHEQPGALLDTLHPRLKDGLPCFEQDGLSADFFSRFERLHFVACGTASYAGTVGKTLVEKLARIPAEVDLASEFRYRDPLLAPDSLVIAISQSGETADTLAALRLAKRRGVTTLAVVNAAGSSIAREADFVLHTYAGPEIAVASTKAYSVQVAVSYLLALAFANARGLLDDGETRAMSARLLQAAEATRSVLAQSDSIRAIAGHYTDAHSLFFIGRGLDHALAMEGALKLKEISYIHSEAYAAGELKHGTISLITEGVPVAALITQEELLAKSVSNIREARSRGGFVLLFAKEGLALDEDIYDDLISLKALDSLFMPLLLVVALQLFAYHVAVARGCDVDKPRNLAKSVTVE